MGSKIVKAILLFLIVLFLNTGTSFAQNIPLVRVGISDTNFKKLLYNEITIFATDDFGIYDKKTSKLILNFSKEDVVRFIYKEKKFDIEKNSLEVAKNFSGTIVVHSPKGILGIEGLKRKSKQALYHGVFELTPRNEKEFFIVNVLDLQEYLKGVVPNEMPVTFGLEALKAQTIAARNYVLMPRARAYKEFDVDDSVASQVYFGANTESELSTQAVNETLGLVALYNLDLILAQYCSTAGGYTEDYANAFSDNQLKKFPAIQKPYLKGKPDIYNTSSLETEDAARNFYTSTPNSYDINSPYYRWQKIFEKNELENTLKRTLNEQSKTGFVYPFFTENNEIGELKEINVLKRGVSGKIMELEIVTTKGIWKVSKELVIRRVFQKNGISLPSANVVFDFNEDKIIAYGGGFGHGVGMSQFGAGFMAKSLNKNFIEILKHYYSGITISTIPQLVADKPVSISFYAPRKKGTLVIENQFNLNNLYVDINGEKIIFPLDKKIFINETRINISKYIKKGLNDITFENQNCETGKYVKAYVELEEKDD